MQLKTALLSLLAAVASAAPSGKSCPAPVRKFGIMALRSASPIHFARVSATQNTLVLNLPDDKQDAQCEDGQAPSSATFYIKDEELYLYGKNPKQWLVADRSGMGLGILQYHNKTSDTPSGRLEVKGWAIDENDNLTFNGNGLLACPSTTDDTWFIRIDVGVEKPHGIEGCLGFSARTVTVTDPVKCTYSLYSA